MTEDGYATPDEMFAYWACVMAVMLFFFVFATLGVEKLEKMIQEAETKSDTSEYETDSEAESSEETEEEDPSTEKSFLGLFQEKHLFD